MSWSMVIALLFLQTGSTDELPPKAPGRPTAEGGPSTAAASPREPRESADAYSAGPTAVLDEASALERLGALLGRTVEPAEAPHLTTFGARPDRVFPWKPPAPAEAYYRIRTRADGGLAEYEVDAVDGHVRYFIRPEPAGRPATVTAEAAETTARTFAARHLKWAADPGELVLADTQERNGRYRFLFVREAGEPLRELEGGATVFVSRASGEIVELLTMPRPPVTALPSPTVTREDAIRGAAAGLGLRGYDEAKTHLTQSGDVLFWQVSFTVRPEHLPAGIADSMGQASAYVGATTGEVLEGSGIMRAKGGEVVAGKAEEDGAGPPQAVHRNDADAATDVAEAATVPSATPLPWLAGGGAVVLLGAVLGAVSLRRRVRAPS